jgi:hypothetical protein
MARKLGRPQPPAVLGAPPQAFSAWASLTQASRGRAVKSGWNYAGYHMNMSSENILARNCSSNGRGGYTSRGRCYYCCH